MTAILLVATSHGLLRVDGATGTAQAAADWHAGRPTALAADPWLPGCAWCATRSEGVFRTEDGGVSWLQGGLVGERLTALAASRARRDLIWAGTEPSAVWRSEDGGADWRHCSGLKELPSAPEWSFPPRPHTHHVRYLTPHPTSPDHVWAAIEAGALVRTVDGGRTWIDRVPGGPYDTHELAVHRETPDGLHSAAGDGYYESSDGGQTWTSPMEGLEVGYLRSVAIDPADPGVVVVSAASHPHSAYAAGSADGRVYRREGRHRWRRVTAGWPDQPSTIAPLLVAGARGGELWAADERGVHHSSDGGANWHHIAAFDPAPRYVESLALVSA